MLTRQVHAVDSSCPPELTLAFLHDLLPQRLHQDGVRVSPTVDDGQFTLGQLEMISKLPVKLSKKALIYMRRHHSGIQ